MAAETTFFQRAFLGYVHQARASFQRGMDWYDVARFDIGQLNDRVVGWVTRHRRGIIVTIAILVAGATIYLFITDLNEGRIANSSEVGIGGLVGTPILGIIIGALAALLIYLVLWLVDKILLVVFYVLAFVPILLGIPIYAVYLVLVVASQCLLLVPLTALVVANRVWLLWRRIFYTCPRRDCAYRGLPSYLCRGCGARHSRLWPNWRGVFYHPCACGEALPTLDILGRDKLMRVCAKCDTALPDASGRLPEEMVALVGGPSVGKTVYALMSLKGVMQMDKAHPIRLKFADARQEKYVGEMLELMDEGHLPDMTLSSWTDAYKLELSRSSTQSLLYFYDAPGEDYSTFQRFGHQEMIRYVNGLILLVDPFTLRDLRYTVKPGDPVIKPSATPFDDVVGPTINAVHQIRGTTEQCAVPLAIVITKADTQPVKNRLGDITQQLPTSDACRQALIDWGARNEIITLENVFLNCKYFACSALGPLSARRKTWSFKSYGVIEPLLWVLDKRV